MSDTVRTILKQARQSGRSLLDWRKELDPEGYFEVDAVERKSKEEIEEEFMEYLSITHGIEPEAF